ncbi:MAG: hypothetical protein JOZ52_04780 [Acidobacteria bacterium]|nr:hypothetical protein [Acidobacteriota bacterium]
MFIYRYDLRWRMSDEKADKIQTIAVHNCRQEGVKKIFIDLDVASGSVADFDFATVNEKARTSFIDTLSDAAAAPPLSADEVDQLIPLVDKRANTRDLCLLDKTLDAFLLHQLQTDHVTSGLAQTLTNGGSNTDNWYASLSDQCFGEKAATNACDKIKSLFFTWERARGIFREAAFKNWHDKTGVAVYPDGNQLALSGKVLFSLDLEPKESAYLRIRYNNDPKLRTQAKANVSAGPDKSIVQVQDAADLDISPLRYFIKSNGFLLLILSGVLLLFLRFSYPVLIPLSLVPIQKVFKIAVTTDDQDFWEHAYQRYRFYVWQQFRDLQIRHSKPKVKFETEELLDHIRDKMTVHYRKKPRQLIRCIATQKKLNAYIRDQLLPLVIKAK